MEKLEQLISENQRLRAERDEADRRAGAAERSAAAFHEDNQRFEQVRRRMKEQWGVHNNVPFDKGDDVLAALDKGDIEAAIFVGGAPLGTISKLGPQYKLLPVPAPVLEKLKGVYRPARLNYQKMGATGVATVATDALFVTREYKTPKMTDGLAKLRACATESIDELRETTGTHPAWQGVNAENRGKWPWYELPSKNR